MPHFTVNFGSQRDPANNFSGRVRTKEAWATAGKANALHFPASDSRSNNSGLNVAQDLAADELVASENHSTGELLSPECRLQYVHLQVLLKHKDAGTILSTINLAYKFCKEACARTTFPHNC